MPTRASKFTTTTTGSENQKPVAILATYKIDALLGSIIQLDGRQSYDPEKQPLSWRWRFVTVPIGSTVEDSGFRDIRPSGTAVSFIPDKTGFYVVELVVNDGELDSDPVTSTINIQLTRVPIGENLVPDAQFLWNYISNFWSLVEDREIITSIWSSVIQTIGSDLITLWGTDNNKSLSTIQGTFQRRWQPFDTSTDLLSEIDQRIIVGKTDSGSVGYTGKIGEEPGSETTQIFYTPRGTYRGVTETDFTKLSGNYGAKGRIVSVNSEGYTIQRASNELNVVASGTDLSIYGVGQAQSVHSTFEDSGVLPGQWLVIKNGSYQGTYKVSSVVSQQLLVITYLNGDPVTFSIPESNLIFEIGVPYTVLVVDEDSIPDGQAGIPWRLPNLLHTPSINLEDSGIRKGDVLIFDVTRGDLGLSAELRAQVVCVDRYRLGFEFSVSTLTDDATEVMDRSSIQQLMLDLKIVPPDATQVEIDGAAEAFIAFMPVAINLATRPFTTYRLTLKAKRVIHNTFVPFDENLISVPALQEAIKDAPVILRENLDYIVESGGITFIGSLFTPEDPAPEKLWAECVILDNSGVIEQNFGRLVNLSKDDLTATQTRAPYLSAVKGLFFAFTNGPTISNIRLGLQILMGLPFTEERGTILERQDSFTTDTGGNSLGRLLVEDVDDKNRRTGFRRFYFYPTSVGLEVNPTTGSLYQTGDIIERFVPISKGIDVKDYVKDPYWWRRALAGLEILKYFTFKVVVDSEVFDSNDIAFAFEFIKAIKPKYTQAITTALTSLSDDIESEDVIGGAATLRFYDNAWGLEATNKATDDNQLGFTLWHAGSKPFQTRTLHRLTDVKTYKSGSFVMVHSDTGWNTAHIRGRSSPFGLFDAEGDILVILQGQLGAASTTPGMYEIATVVDSNELIILNRAPFADPLTFDAAYIDAGLFEYGEGLHCCIVRRGSNPIAWGEDLVTNISDNKVTSATALFLTNAVSVGDSLVIESGANAGEYLIDVTVPFAPGPPQVAPHFTESQVSLLTMDGDVPTFSAATGQDFRVVRRNSQPRVVYGAQSVFTGSRIELLVSDPITGDPFDVFTPRMTGSFIDIANSEDSVNDGHWLIVEYLSNGRVALDSGSTSSDAAAQSTIYFQPPMEVDEIRPTEKMNPSLIGDDTPGVNNRLVLAANNQFSVDPAFVPAINPYTFEGPPDGTTNPVQLGFVAGDQIQLSQASGEPVGPNEGALVTIQNPVLITIFESLIYPDATAYKFRAIKRGV